MAKRRKKRRKIRLTPLGYVVVGIFVIVMLVGIYFLIWSLAGDSGEQQQEQGIEMPGSSASAPITPTPSLPPVNIPESAPPVTNPPETPTPEPTETPTPEVQKTPEPEVQTPSPSQVKSALDGKLTSKLNLRKGPTKDHAVIKSFESGTRLKIYAREGDFYFVMVVKENLYGYMAAQYIEKEGLLPGEDPTPTPEAPKGAVPGKVSASTVALRSGPSTDSKALGDAARGDMVYVYYKVDDFYYIEIVKTGQKCYAYAKYISADGDVPRATPKPAGDH